VYCSHCEKDMPNDFKFCPVCGSPPEKKSSPPPGEYSRQFNPSSPQPKPASYSQNNPPPPPPPNYNPNPQNNPPPPPPPNYNPNPQNNPQYQVGYKSEGTASVLAILLGLIALCGIGQIYAGKIGRGICILIGNWVLLVIGVATLIILIGIPILIGALALFIWQIIDARNLCRKYNDYLANNGRPPW